MTSRLKNKRRFIVVATSDSESDVPLYKKERLQQVKEIKSNLRTLCDNDSPNGTSSDNDIMFVNQRSKTRRTNLSGRNNNKNQKVPLQFKSKIFETDSDSSTTDDFRRNIRRQTKDKENEVVKCDSDDSSSDSCISLIKSKEKFLGKSSVDKHGKKSNSKKSNIKSNNTKDAQCSQIIESESNEGNCNGSNIPADNGPSIPAKDNPKVQGKKRTVPVNFKPYIVKVMEEIKHRFTKFKVQITSLQQKYLKDDIILLQDAKDIIFILTCIISRLKEEFTENQKDLMDSYVQWSMKHNYTHSVMSMESMQILNNNDLQVQSKTPTSIDANEEITPLFHRKQPLQVKRSVPNSVQLSNKDSVPHENNEPKTTLSSKKNNNSATFEQTNKNNVTLQNNQLAFSVSKEGTRPNEVTSSIRGLIQNPKKIRYSSCALNEKLVEQRIEIKRDFFKNLLNAERDEVLNYDSDIDSTCSTLNLHFSEGLDEQQNNEIDVTVHKDKSKNDVAENITLNTVHNDVQKRSLYHINSEDTVFLNRNTPGINSYIADKEKSVTSLSNEKLTDSSDFELFVPNKNNFNKNYRSKYGSDKKLQMKCQVLVEKCKL